VPVVQPPRRRPGGAVASDHSGLATSSSRAETPPAPHVKAGGEFRPHQADAILELTLVAALAMSAATASGFEIYIAWLPEASATLAPARVAIWR
jgi:hypothetical protein